MSELDEIRRQYDSGELNSIKEDLGHFICLHRSRILDYRAEQEGKGLSLPDDAAIKFYLLRYRSINPAREIREQLEEIQKEKWIRGVLSGCPPDSQEVALEWARTHSAAWRQHRVTTIVYVFEQEKARYCAMLRA
ncbi:MAG TPA: hypothetical protein VE981_23045 [Planctomycetota bacterium]|nr:hypothetical protein [Planctomycetota bacterium]